MKALLTRLVIDSATKFLFVGLYHGTKCLSQYHAEGHNDHSVKLMTEIEKGLNEHQLKVSDIDEIIIGIGPGSYTGLRIGVVVAKMFGWNNNIQVKSVSSLALMASSNLQETLILSEIDARRGNSFLGLYEYKNGMLCQKDQEQLTNLDDYKNSIIEPFIVVSNGVPNIEVLLNSNLLSTIKDIHGLNPNYLRLTEAERNLK